MLSTSVTAGLATIFTLNSLVVALPWPNAGSGTGASNSCDLRSDLIEYTYGKKTDRPQEKDCRRLMNLFANKDLYPGDRVKISGETRTFTFQSCQILVEGEPTFEENKDRQFYIGFNDLADLVGSALQDFIDQDAKAENPDPQETVVKSKGGKQYAIQEDNTVKCEAVDNGEQIVVSYEVGKPKTGYTLQDPEEKGHKGSGDDKKVDTDEETGETGKNKPKVGGKKPKENEKPKEKSEKSKANGKDKEDEEKDESDY